MRCRVQPARSAACGARDRSLSGCDQAPLRGQQPQKPPALPEDWLLCRLGLSAAVAYESVIQCSDGVVWCLSGAVAIVLYPVERTQLVTGALLPLRFVSLLIFRNQHTNGGLPTRAFLRPVPIREKRNQS